jgi:SHS2 domain-containing protein
MGFEYLDHTADLKIRAHGSNLEDAFVNAALGGFNFLTDVTKVDKKIVKTIRKQNSRMESLLYDFLEELLFLLDTEGFVFSGVKKMSISKGTSGDFELDCVALGDNIKNYSSKGDLKAITYSDMKIEAKKKDVTITVVFDI